jgi:hypothetical protein
VVDAKMGKKLMGIAQTNNLSQISFSQIEDES